MAGAKNNSVSGSSLPIQRFSGKFSGQSLEVPASVERVLASPGQPLDARTRSFMEPRFGQDFSHVRVHTDAAAQHSARAVNARAYTVGSSVVFGEGQYDLSQESGKQLLAHELVHVVQQSGSDGGGYGTTRARPVQLARSVDDWLTGSLNVSAWSYTQLVSEIDELTQYLNRQISSSPETVRVEEALTQLRAEVNRRETAAAGPRSRGRGRTRGHARTAPASSEPLPARYPRILTEMTSVAYADPAEMRVEYDLIMQWLARSEISDTERRILTAERDNLAPQFRSDRERVVRERHAARITATLSPSESEDSNALEHYARTIQGIVADPEHPGVYFIYHNNERIAISGEQLERLRHDLADQLRHVTRQLESRNSYYWDRYNSQLAINRDSPIIAGITGWLADVEDPGDELRTRYFWAYQRLRTVTEHLRAGRMVEAASILGPVERVSQEIRELSRAFYEGHIEGAETAVRRLEFTRDASFAIAGSIGAVVAAPVVAGYVAGAGFTGATATVLTVGGTGVTVGTGMGVVRGTSAAAGELAAGNSLNQALSSFRSEFSRGFREGFVAGAAGGAARLLGLAAGASASVGEQVFVRVAGDFVVNSTSTMLDVLWQSCMNGHCDVDRAVQLGITNGLTSIPGSIVGLSNSAIARNFLAPLTAGATTYVGAISSGASPEDAMRSAGLAVTTNLAMSRAAHGADTDAALFERGRSMGESHRATAAYATRRVASVGAAIMIGTSDALPPLRSGYGGTSVVMEGDITGAAVSGTGTRPSAPVDTSADIASTTGAPIAGAETASPVTTATAPDAEAAVTATPSTPHADTEATTPATTIPLHAEGETATPAASTTAATAEADDLNIEAAFSETAPTQTGAPRSVRLSSRVATIVLTALQRVAAARLIGQRFNSQLRQAWNQTRNAREVAEIQQIQNLWNSGARDDARALARAAFDRHRGRFWRAVRRDPALRQIFLDAGMSFVGGSSRPPVYLDPATGNEIDFMSLEHGTRLTDDPTLALDGNNLQTVLGYENSVTLESIRRTDEFQ